MTRFRRILRIGWVIGRYRLDTLVPRTGLPPALRLLLALSPWRLFPVPALSRGERLRRALEALGPVFVKFGQILSTRRDLLPDDMAEPLRQLQDRVPPFPGEEARAIVEADLGRPVAELFADFDIEPLASASVAQVHGARLPDGRAVVVKVIRPGIERVIRQDIALMYLLAGLLARSGPDGRRLRPVEVVADYERTIFDELDMQREGASASQLRRNFEGSNLIYHPEIHWDHSSRRVLVMERVSGIPIGEVDRLRAADVNLRVLAEKGVEIFFTQVFRDSFFHADMHPGNIFVDASNPADPRYIALDFGIVGTLSPEDKSYLAHNLLAFFKRDYHEVARLHVQSGWVPPHTRVNEFESAIRTVCEPIFERPLSEISFGYFLLRLFQTARRFEMEVQPQLVLLQKTLLNVEGLGRQLYPQLDLWQTAQPFLERWMREQVGPQGLWRAFRQQLPGWLEQTPEMPQLIHDALIRLSQPAPAAQVVSNTDEKTPPKGARRYWLGGLCLAAALALGHAGIRDWLQALPPESWALLGLGAWLLRPR